MARPPEGTSVCEKPLSLRYPPCENPIRAAIRTGAWLVLLFLSSRGSGWAAMLSLSAPNTVAGATERVEIRADSGVPAFVSASLELHYRATSPAGAPNLKLISTDLSTALAGPAASLSSTLSSSGVAGLKVTSLLPVQGPVAIATVTFQVPDNLTRTTTYGLDLAEIRVTGLLGKHLSVQGGRTSFTATPLAAVSVDSATVRAGDAAAICVRLSTAISDIAGVRLSLTIAPSADSPDAPLPTVASADVSPGSLIQGPGSTIVANTTTPGQLQIAAIGSQGAQGAGTLACVTFHTSAALQGPVSYKIQLTDVELNDPQGNPIAHGPLETGTLTVNLASAEGHLVVTDGAAAPGGAGSLEVLADPLVKDIAGAQLTLRFTAVDPSNNTLPTIDGSDVSAGPLVGGADAVTVANPSAPGAVYVSVRGSRSTNGPGVLARIVYHVPESLSLNAQGLAIFAVQLDEAEITRANGESATVASMPGQVIVTNKPIGQVSVKTNAGPPGGSAEVVIEADSDVHQVAGAQFELWYGESTPSGVALPSLSSADVAPGVLLAGTNAVAAPTALEAGIVRIDAAASAPQDGPGSLVSLRFHLPQVMAGTAYTVRLVHAELTDASGSPIAVNTVSDQLTLTSLAPGDLNGDGRVTLSDAVLALRIVVGELSPTPSQVQAADVAPLHADGTYGDGKVTIADVVRLIDRAVGIDNSIGWPSS